MNSGYILIACGFVLLAIALNLRSKGPGGAQRAAMAFRLWLTRDLYRGDLTALGCARRGIRSTGCAGAASCATACSAACASR